MPTTSFFTHEKTKQAWQNFVQNEGLTSLQEEQFARYLDLLIAWNENINLTAIVEPTEIIAYHFQDSLAIDRSLDFKTITTFIDVGTGAGFPGIPLLIKYPTVQGILLEVNKKRIAFLDKVMQELKLENCTVYDIDWRTFLRKTDYKAQAIFSRASLHTEELMRMFKPSSPYKNATLVYWASKEWQISESEKPFFTQEVPYTIKNKKRRLIFFDLQPLA